MFTVIAKAVRRRNRHPGLLVQINSLELDVRRQSLKKLLCAPKLRFILGLVLRLALLVNQFSWSLCSVNVTVGSLLLGSCRVPIASEICMSCNNMLGMLCDAWPGLYTARPCAVFACSMHAGKPENDVKAF